MDSQRIKELAEMFCNEPTAKREVMSAQHADNFRSLINRFITVYRGEEGEQMELAVRKFLLSLRSSGVSVSSCRYYASTLARFMSRYYLISDEQAAKLTATFPNSTKDWSNKALDTDTIQSTYDAFRARNLTCFAPLRDYIILSVCLLTGMRVSQVVGVASWHQSEDGDLCLNTVRQKNKMVHPVQKWIPFSTELPDSHIFGVEFSRYVIKRRVTVGTDCPYLFPNNAGGCLTTSYIRKSMRHFAGIHPHQLRHTCATIVAREVGVSQAAELLDHADISTTMRYIKLSSDSNSSDTIKRLSTLLTDKSHAAR